jgi:diadenosine tetraphosphatase ApaH/serine/threonine PP2A family protein phosphatase
MMGSRRDKERWTIRTVFIKYGRDQRHVWQMRSTLVRIIRDETIPRVHSRKSLDHRLNGSTHGAQVDWNMGCIGDQLSSCIEYRTTEIPPLFDIDAHCRLLEHDPHLIGDRCDPLRQDLAKDRIELSLMLPLQVLLDWFFLSMDP